MTLSIILETSKDDFQGVISHPDFTILGMEESMDALIATFKAQIEGLLEDDLKDKPQWQGVTIEAIEFEYVATIEGLFDTFDFLKISAVAREAGINESQLRQYANGIKYPSIAIAKKIEQAVHRLGKSMLSMQVAQVPPTRVPTA